MTPTELRNIKAAIRLLEEEQTGQIGREGAIRLLKSTLPGWKQEQEMQARWGEALASGEIMAEVERRVEMGMTRDFVMREIAEEWEAKQKAGGA